MTSTGASAHPTRSRTRSFSIHSDRSNKSNKHTKKPSVGRIQETTAEKESHRLQTKADPTMAMNEAEPSAMHTSERTLLAPLRSIQHRDMFGNPIAEPDKSNPTRSRWERPLDTIRSFEAAIDGPSAQRTLTHASSEADWNRRGSYYGTRSNAPSRPPSIYSMPANLSRSSYQDGHYGSRPNSHIDARPPPHPTRDSYHEPYHYGSYGPHNGGSYPPRHHGSRQHLHALYSQGRNEPNGVYPTQHRDRSYETVTSAGGSGSLGDQGSYQTDPSSDNSSLNRASPLKPLNDHGIALNGPTNYQPTPFSVEANRNKSGAPMIQKKPVPIALGGAPSVPEKSHMAVQPELAPAKPAAEKRKSWLSRRFSRKS